MTGGRSFQVASYSGPYTPGYITYMKLDGLTGLVAGSFTIEDLPEPVEPVEAKEPK